MTFPVRSFSEEVKSFINEHKVLCTLTLGLAIVGFSLGTLGGRAVAWIRQCFETTEKTDSVGREIITRKDKNLKISEKQDNKYHPLLEVSTEESSEETNQKAIQVLTKSSTTSTKKENSIVAELNTEREASGQPKPIEIAEESIQNRQELAEIRKQAAMGLLEGKPATDIAGNVSMGMKTFIARLYKEAEQKLGPPPCSYCVVGLGSLARNESGPYPDYDNFMIIKDRTPENILYFTKLNQHVADRVYRLGEEQGLRFCGGNLNSPYQTYEHRYSSNIEVERTIAESPSKASPAQASADVQEQIEATFKRPIYGGRLELLEDPHEVRANLGDIVDSAPIVGDVELYQDYMKSAFENESTEALAIGNIKRNIDGINGDSNQSPIKAPKLPEIIHVKEQLFRLPQATITSLAVYHGIKEKNSIERIEKLTERGVFTPVFAERLKKAIGHLIGFRIQAQTAYGEELEFVSTGDWNSFKVHNEATKEKLEKAEKELENEEIEVGKIFPEVKKAIDKCQKEIKEVDVKIAEAKTAVKPKWGVRTLEKEKQRLKAELMGTTIKACQSKIKELDGQIADGGDRTVSEQQKKQLEDICQRLFDKNGLIEYYQDILNPKIAENQYSDQMKSKTPTVVAFKQADRALLETEILPTLRDLFEMAEESIKGGTFNPSAFAKK